MFPETRLHFVGDAGLDDAKIFHQMDLVQADFTLRASHNRTVEVYNDRLDRWETESMGELAATVPVGARGLLFLPYLLGERSPYWNPLARGAFVGLAMPHGRAELLETILHDKILGPAREDFDGPVLGYSAGHEYKGNIRASPLYFG